MVKRKSPKFPKKRILIFAALVIVAGLTVFFVTKDSPRPVADNTTNESSDNSDGINFDPPTEEELATNNQNKDKIVNNDSNASSQPTSSKKQVDVVISYADASGIGAYAVGIFEEGGTCTATVKQAGKTFTKTSTGFGNASYTQCTPMSLDGLGVNTTQQWDVTISYASAKAEGTSDKTTVSP